MANKKKNIFIRLTIMLVSLNCVCVSVLATKKRSGGNWTSSFWKCELITPARGDLYLWQRHLYNEHRFARKWASTSFIPIASHDIALNFKLMISNEFDFFSSKIKINRIVTSNTWNFLPFNDVFQLTGNSSWICCEAPLNYEKFVEVVFQFEMVQSLLYVELVIFVSKKCAIYKLIYGEKRNLHSATIKRAVNTYFW